MIDSFTRDGLTFDVTDSGPASGDPVVLLHGFPERRGSWDAVAARLHRQGLRTLAPDQRGYSSGARPRGRSAYRLPRLVGDVVALVDEVGGPVHLVGHDWGAVVAWRLAIDRPDLVRTLTAVSVPHPGAFAAACARGAQLLRSWYVLPFNVPLLPELAARHLPALVGEGLRRSGMTPERVALFQREIVADGALPHALGWYRALPLSARGTAGTAKERVTVPTTMVWSDGDNALDRSGAELCGRFVDADYELVVLEGVSHWIPTEAPDALADAVMARIGTAR